MDLTARFLNPGSQQKVQVRSCDRDLAPSPPPPAGVTRLRQIQKRLPAEEIMALVKQYESGASVSQLTTVFGIHRTTVLEHLKRHDIPRRPSIAKLTPAMITQATELYAAGWSYLKLGQHFDVNDSTVRKALVRHGVISRPPGRRRG